jgi:hypothetical protein
MRIGPLPDWADELGDRLYRQELMGEKPDQEA